MSKLGRFASNGLRFFTHAMPFILLIAAGLLSLFPLMATDETIEESHRAVRKIRTRLDHVGIDGTSNGVGTPRLTEERTETPSATETATFAVPGNRYDRADWYLGERMNMLDERITGRMDLLEERLDGVVDSTRWIISILAGSNVLTVVAAAWLVRRAGAART